MSSTSVEASAPATTATVAAVFPEGETPSREALEAELGASATDREVTIDGNRVSVTASWAVVTTTVP